MQASTERPSSVRADLALLGVTAIWGFTFPAVQLALRDVRPLTFLAARFGLATLILAGIFGRRAFRLSGRGLLAAVLLGLCLTSGSILQTIGLTHTTASKSAFITALYVVMVPLIAMIGERVRLRVSSLLAAALATAGLWLITQPGVHGFNLGDLLTVGCSVAFAFHILIAEAATPHHDVVALTFWQVLTTAVTCAICMTAVEPSTRPAGEGLAFPLTQWTLTALLVTAVLATALAFAVQMWAQRETSATHAAVIFTGEPVFAALFAGWIQGAWLGKVGVVGAALIVTGMLLAQIGARPRSSGAT